MALPQILHEFQVTVSRGKERTHKEDQMGEVVSNVPAEDVAKIKKAARDYFLADEQSKEFSRSALGEVLKDMKQHSCTNFTSEMTKLSTANIVGAHFDENVRITSVQKDAQKKGVDRIDFAWEASSRSLSDIWNNVPSPKVNPAVSFDLSHVKCPGEGPSQIGKSAAEVLGKAILDHVKKK